VEKNHKSARGETVMGNEVGTDDIVDQDDNTTGEGGEGSEGRERVLLVSNS